MVNRQDGPDRGDPATLDRGPCHGAGRRGGRGRRRGAGGGRLPERRGRCLRRRGAHRGPCRTPEHGWQARHGHRRRDRLSPLPRTAAGDALGRRAAYHAPVNCRACGRALEPGSRFCPSCGTPVEAACRSCGASLAADARFCASCGTPVVAAAGPLADESPDTGRERKLATIVFADLVGFTSLNESSDPELVQALVTRAFDRLSAEVGRYEGTVEKFAGDAMLAVFGVPATHEDDAERAVRAALEMQAAMSELAAELRAEGRPELALRIGVETGEVLVDLGRAQGERDRIVTGDAVNTAARLQGVAAPGTIVVGPFTYAATRDVVEYEELPPTALKGKALPVAAWRAVAVQ